MKMGALHSMPCPGRYVGRDGLMGLKSGEVYTVEVFIQNGKMTRVPIICVARVEDPRYFLPYSSMKRLQQSWDFVNI